MTQWNAQFTQLIRKSHPALWGNWTLSGEVSPGAIGILDPSNGTFKRIAVGIPDLSIESFITKSVSASWDIMSNNVLRTDMSLELDAEVTDPDSGVTGSAGMEIVWTFGSEGSMLSRFVVESESMLNDLDVVAATHMEWLVSRASQSGMGSGTGSGTDTDVGIAQGFGIITSVLYASSGLNVGSMASDNTFSIKGSASAVKKMVGEVKGKGSYSSASSSKSVAKQLWPAESGSLAEFSAPVAYTFASFDGKLLLPRWITHISAYRLIISNNNGGTYIVHATLRYDTPRGKIAVSSSVSGGLSTSFDDIPLDATNLDLELAFVAGPGSNHRLQWRNPRGQWIGGVRNVGLSGVWPSQTYAVDVEAGI